MPPLGLLRIHLFLDDDLNLFSRCMSNAPDAFVEFIVGAFVISGVSSVSIDCMSIIN